jgi:hypothetical protein
MILLAAALVDDHPNEVRPNGVQVVSRTDENLRSSDPRASVSAQPSLRIRDYD